MITIYRLFWETMENLELKPGISVFFPAYNDENTIEHLVIEALEILDDLTDDYEVIIVNDGSSDSTAEILNNLAKKIPEVKVIHHEQNQGYGGALRSGFKSAGKSLIFYTDGDGQYSVSELRRLFPLMKDNVDVVNGYKTKRSDKTHRKIIGGIYNQTARLFFRLPIRDVDCDFRLIRRSVVKELDLISTSGVICVELIHKLAISGCVFAEAPVTHFPRQFGKSQFFTVRRVGKTVFDFFVLWIKIGLFPLKRVSSE